MSLASLCGGLAALVLVVATPVMLVVLSGSCEWLIAVFSAACIVPMGFALVWANGVVFCGITREAEERIHAVMLVWATVAHTVVAALALASTAYAEAGCGDPRTTVAVGISEAAVAACMAVLTTLAYKGSPWPPL